jgi:hypothetical protein
MKSHLDSAAQRAPQYPPLKGGGRRVSAGGGVGGEAGGGVQLAATIVSKY